MKIGDIVKLIDNPKHDWMQDYLDKHFEVRDIDSIALTLEMVGSEPEWIWSVGKDNFELVEEIENGN
jgi:hypothetical protein